MSSKEGRWNTVKYLPLTIIFIFGLMAMSETRPPVEKTAKVLKATMTNTVEVMSFNIHHDADNWSGYRNDLVIRAIQRENPDVVGLQEAHMWQVNELVSELPQYGFVGRGRSTDGSGESVSILYSKQRFDVDQSGTFWFSNRPDVPGSKPGRRWGNPTLPRICTWVRLVQKSTSKAFYVYNVHLQHNRGTDPELARVSSVLLLTERIRQRNPKDPYVVTGDFNAAPDEVPIRFLTEGNTQPILYCPASGVLACHELINLVPMIDTWSLLHPTSTAGTRCNGGSGTGRRIDYVFVDPEGVVDAAEIGRKVSGACPSDHAPMTAVLMLPLGGEQFL